MVVVCRVRPREGAGRWELGLTAGRFFFFAKYTEIEIDRYFIFAWPVLRWCWCVGQPRTRHKRLEQRILQYLVYLLEVTNTKHCCATGIIKNYFRLRVLRPRVCIKSTMSMPREPGSRSRCCRARWRRAVPWTSRTTSEEGVGHLLPVEQCVRYDKHWRLRNSERKLEECTDLRGGKRLHTRTFLPPPYMVTLYGNHPRSGRRA